MWRWVHKLYGSELGLTASDDDYEAPDSVVESDYPEASVSDLAFMF